MSTPMETNTEGLQDILESVLKLPNASGSGLPAGISALDCGTYTPETDITSNVSIAHNLGDIPDFTLIYIPGEVSAEAHLGCVIWSIILLQPFSTSTAECSGFRYHRFYNESNGNQSNGYSNITAYYLSDWLNKDTFAVYASDGVKLKAGVTYTWIACKFAQ